MKKILYLFHFALLMVTMPIIAQDKPAYLIYDKSEKESVTDAYIKALLDSI